ncbi:hypothetical protein D3C72_2576210 [compost metagenome]
MQRVLGVRPAGEGGVKFGEDVGLAGVVASTTMGVFHPEGFDKHDGVDIQE